AEAVELARDLKRRARGRALVEHLGGHPSGARLACRVGRAAGLRDEPDRDARNLVTLDGDDRQAVGERLRLYLGRREVAAGADLGRLTVELGRVGAPRHLGLVGDAEALRRVDV